MKKFVCLSVLAAVAVLSGCTKLNTLESELDKAEKELADHANLPNGIVLETQKIENVCKGDVVELDIIVNPSDFALKKENLSLMATHHLFTKGDTFDKNAKCDLSIIELVQDSEYEGEYTLIVSIDGEGCFFDDLSTFVLYGEKDSKDKMRYICSGTSASMTVVPPIKDAFNLDIRNQSFYSFTLDQMNVNPDGTKTQVFGLWFNFFTDEYGVKRVYDRSVISSIQLTGDECTKCCTLRTDTFKDTGIIKIELDKSAQFWSDAVKKYEQEGTLFTNYPSGSAIRVSKKEENADFSLDEAKLFFKSVCEYEKTVTLEELQRTGTVNFDISKDLESAGYDASLKVDGITMDKASVAEERSNVVLTDYVETNIVEMTFFNYSKIQETRKISGIISRDYSYSVIQLANGTFAKQELSAPKLLLLSFYAKVTTKLSD